MNKNNFFQIPFEQKNIAETETGVKIKGLASTRNLDRYGDSVEPTAFSKTLEAFMKNPVMLLQHNQDKPIGRFLSAEVVNDGLEVVGEILYNEDDVVSKVKSGIMQAIEQKKLIIFNFPKGQMPIEYRILGLFVVGTIKIISFRRDGKEFFTPCHLFIDEFQNFITPSLQEILEESRKYKLYLTLAQQQAGARMGSELFKSILGNTAIKLTGINGVDTLKTLAQETGDSVENLQNNLAIGRFALWQKAKIGDTQKPPIIITMPKNTLGNRQSMNNNQWEALKIAQIEAFYRPIAQTTKTPLDAPKTPKNTQILDDFDDYFNTNGKN